MADDVDELRRLIFKLTTQHVELWAVTLALVAFGEGDFGQAPNLHFSAVLIDAPGVKR